MTTNHSHRLEILAACGLALLVVVYAVKVASYWRIVPVELGRSKPTLVSAETRARLSSLRDDVFITYYVTGRARMPSHMRRVERGVTEVLQALKAASQGRIDFQRVDPDTDVDLQRFAGRHGVAPFRARTVLRDAYSERTVWSTLTIRYGERPESLISSIGPDHIPRLQRLILDHLAQLERPRRPIVAVSRASGYSELSAELSTRADVIVSAVSQGRVPSERVDVLFWLDPEGRPDELRIVDDFLETGRSVVVAGSAIRPLLRRTGNQFEVSFDLRTAGIEAAFGHFALRAQPGVVLDASAAELPRGDGVTAPFFVRSLAYTQDFRSLRGQPNGALLFLAPTALALDGAALQARGWTADVLVTTSDRASLAPVPQTAVPLRSLTVETGVPAPKLPLAVLLQPKDPWRGMVLAFGATTPFADGFFSATGAAHKALLRTLLDNMASPERLALHRTGVHRPTPLSELAPGERLVWRTVTILSLPLLLALLIVVRTNVPRVRRSRVSLPRRRIIGWTIGLASIAVAVRVIPAHTLRADVSRDSLNQLAPQTRVIAARMRGARAVRAQVVFSSPDLLPPAMRPGLRQLQDLLAELARAGAELSITRMRPEDVRQPERDHLAGLGINRVTVSDNQDGVTTVRRMYASLRLVSGDRSEVLNFAAPASFEALEFRVAFALRRLESGRRPRIAFASDTPRLTPAEAHEQYQTQSLMAPTGTDVYSGARGLLAEHGFDVMHVDPRQPLALAPDDLLIWLQPRRPLEDLLNVMIRHLHAGGRVLLAAQHFNVQARQYRGTGFGLVYWPQPQWPEIDELYFPAIGIHLVREVLFDELSTAMRAETHVSRGARPEIDRQVTTLPFVVRASTVHFADSPVTRGLGDQAFVYGSYIRWDEARLRAVGLRATPLITTSEHAWSFAWKGGWLPDEILTGPPRSKAGEPRWLGRQALAALFEGRFPLQMVRRADASPFGTQPDGAPSAPSVDQPLEPTARQRNGRLLLIGGTELFKNYRLRTPEFRADHLLLNAVAALLLDDELTAVASHRVKRPGLGRVPPSSRLLWRAGVIGAPVVVLAAVAFVRGVRSWTPRRAQRKPAG